MPECKGCGAKINWIQTARGKMTPVDAKETSIYVTGTQSLVRGHVPHWATCEKAADFKRKV